MPVYSFYESDVTTEMIHYVLYNFIITCLYNYLGANIINVQRATLGVADWSQLALLIGVSQAEYDRIVTNNHSDVRKQQKQIVISWLNAGKASWAILVAGLRDDLVGMDAIANKIAQDHPSKAKPPVPTAAG